MAVEGKRTSRFAELEGLRGLAAMAVVAQHLIQLFFAAAIIGPFVGLKPHVTDSLYNNPLMAVASGGFAVAVFFVLSGFVLSTGYFQTKDTMIVKKLAAKRYLRLMLPALASIFLALTAIRLGLTWFRDFAPLTGYSIWAGDTWHVIPSIKNALYDGFVGIFTSSGSPFNGPLWTMQFEFMGSFIVFGFLLLFGNAKYRWVCYALLLVGLFNTWFWAFILGTIAADLFSTGALKKLKRSWLITAPLLLLAIYLGGYPQGLTHGGLYQVVNYLPNNGIIWKQLALTLGATLLIIVTITTPLLSSFFARPRISKLGKYTFSLYLSHTVVFLTVTTALFMLMYKKMAISYGLSAVLSVACSVPVIGLVAFLFERYIDAPSIKLASYIGEIVLGNKPAPQLEHIPTMVAEKLPNQILTEAANSLSNLIVTVKATSSAFLIRIRQSRMLNLDYQIEEGEAEIEAE